jgi:tetratricopeptide (TPR) repeat protein
MSPPARQAPQPHAFQPQSRQPNAPAAGASRLPINAPIKQPAPTFAEVPSLPGRDAVPSDFPAALGALDESDLPVISGGAPVAKSREAAKPAPPARPAAPVASPAKPAAPPSPAAPPAARPAMPLSEPPTPIDDLDFDLPAVPADLPAARSGHADLPVTRPRQGAPTKGPAPVRPPESRSVSTRPAIQRASSPTAPTFEADLPVPLPAAHPDLPVMRSAVADLPAARAAAAEAKREAFLSDLPVIATGDPSGGAAAGLPVIAAALPATGVGRANLPVAAAALPVRADPRANLPSPAAALPVRQQPGLPDIAATLPVRLDSLPAPLGGTGFGEIELPTFDSVPPTPKAAPPAGNAPPDSTFGLFGEIDLPHESPPSSGRGSRASHGPTSSAPPVDAADFGDLQLDDHPRSMRSAKVPSNPVPSLRSDAPQAAGGMSFGEVDIGGTGGEGSSIGLDAADLGRALEAPVLHQAAASTQVRGPAVRPASVPPKARRRSVVKTVGIGALVLLALAGAALQLTPYGAFGYLVLGDLVRAGDYRRATATAIADGGKMRAPDTYEAAKSALDATVAAQARTDRARPLAAYAAFADYATTMRFGADTARSSRVVQLLAGLPTDQPVQYADVARAEQAAVGGDLAKARKALDDAGKALAIDDPIQRDLALAAGDLAVAARDGAAAAIAFKRALALGDDARVRYGLAVSDDLLGDLASTRQEVDATLASSPGHPGALTLRARRDGAVDAGKALADLAMVLEGPSRSKASPAELSRAYAAKAWVSLERGGATDAREAFAQAVTLDPRNVDALNGQGRLFLNEERATEALARFDTALGIDPALPETIAYDAEAKIALERLADAKQQLAAARERFPKNVAILMLLGRVEQHLGNSDAAEADLRAAIALVDPTRPDAVLPYVALSKLLSERGRMPDAKLALDEAKKKLSPSPALDRAFGEISELQGDYDGAIAHYNAALAKDPKDATSHFRLGVALRRTRKFDEAVTELDKVAAVDKDYPGLSLERGLLFEESGDVQKAIEQFNGALAKAPDDPDLQLRVGAAYVAIGRGDEALPMLHKVLDKRPASAEANHFIGRALMIDGGQSQADALRYLKRAVELDPNRAEFHVYVAWAANDATPAQLELARDEIDKALAIDTVNPEAYWQRGVLERMEGAVEDAVKDENRALALRPTRYEARATLAECYEDKNQDAAALVEWARAIAGDAEAPGSDTVRHPFWRYRYGKLLMEHGGPAAALVQLLPAVATAEKMSLKPGWLAPLEFLVADALRKTGKRADAVDHYKRFLEIAPVNSPDRLDAQQALSALSPH